MAHVFRRLCDVSIDLMSVAYLIVSVMIDGVEGEAMPTYTKTADIGQCARLCAMDSNCLYFDYGPMPGVTADVLCGRVLKRNSSTHTADSHLTGTSAFYNEKLINNDTSEQNCQSFYYVPSGRSRSFNTPISFPSSNRCRIFFVAGIHAKLVISVRLHCNQRCACADLLRIYHVSYVAMNQSKAVSACLDATDSQSAFVVSSAQGSHVTLELHRRAMSQAAFSVTAWSVVHRRDSIPTVTGLVKGNNSVTSGSQCYRRSGYLPACQDHFNIGKTTENWTKETHEITTSTATATETSTLTAMATAMRLDSNLKTTPTKGFSNKSNKNSNSSNIRNDNFTAPYPDGNDNALISNNSSLTLNNNTDDISSNNGGGNSKITSSKNDNNRNNNNNHGNKMTFNSHNSSIPSNNSSSAQDHNSVNASSSTTTTRNDYDSDTHGSAAAESTHQSTVSGDKMALIAGVTSGGLAVVALVSLTSAVYNRRYRTRKIGPSESESGQPPSVERVNALESPTTATDTSPV